MARQIQLIFFDFDGVFTDNRVLVLQDGTEGVICSRADGLGIEALKLLGVKLIVLSKEKNPVVSKRCKKLNIPCIQGCDNKAEILNQEAKKLGISLKEIAYMGNDINDLECLKMVGLPACVIDSHQDITAVSLYVTQAKGGHGAVREFCDYIVKVKTEEKYTE
jgi:YrbI family 3-deoxy-D-manno-octulosonate 8-phosphate phosphatase